MRWSALWFLLGASAALAAQQIPSVVSDPVDPRCTHCGFAVDGGTRIDFPVAISGTDKICKMGLGGLLVGSHSLNATAVIIDPVWGRLESPASGNFTFAVPTIPAVPSGLKLLP